jgi:hypothetical protein
MRAVVNRLRSSELTWAILSLFTISPELEAAETPQSISQSQDLLAHLILSETSFGTAWRTLNRFDEVRVLGRAQTVLSRWIDALRPLDSPPLLGR